METITKKIGEDQLMHSHTALSLEDSRNHPFAHRAEELPSRSLLQTKPVIPITDAEIRSRIQWRGVSSPHFILNFGPAFFQPKEADMLLYHLEGMYHDIFSMTHEANNGSIVVYAFDLNSSLLLGRTARTHFNLAERSIYLVRNGSESMESELFLAIVHAMRFGKYLTHYGITRGWAMLEDSFSVFLSERLRNQKRIFPFYGVDPELIANHLKENTITRSLSSVWTARSFATALERYAIAGSFMLYLGDVMGDDRIVAFSRHDDEITSATFETYFGASLDKLEHRWTEHMPCTLLAYTEDERHEMLSFWLHAAKGKF